MIILYFLFFYIVQHLHELLLIYIINVSLFIFKKRQYTVCSLVLTWYNTFAVKILQLDVMVAVYFMLGSLYKFVLTEFIWLKGSFPKYELYMIRVLTNQSYQAVVIHPINAMQLYGSTQRAFMITWNATKSPLI